MLIRENIVCKHVSGVVTYIYILYIEYVTPCGCLCPVVRCRFLSEGSSFRANLRGSSSDKVDWELSRCGGRGNWLPWKCVVFT